MTTQRLKFTPLRLLHAPPWLDRGSKKRHPQRYKKTEIPSDDTFRGFLKATDFQEAQFCGAIVTARTESGICRLNNALLDMVIAKQSFRGVRSPIKFGNESKNCTTFTRLHNDYFDLSTYINFLLLFLFVFATGCKRKQSFYERHKLTASNYFSDQRDIEFCTAIESDDITKIRSLHQNGVNIQHQGSHGMSFLFWAVLGNRDHAVRYLIEQGASVDDFFDSDFGLAPFFKSGENLLHFILLSRPEYVEIAIKATKDINCKTRYNNDTQLTPIYIVSSNFGVGDTAILDLLVNAGAKIESIPENLPIILYASRYSHIKSWHLVQRGGQVFELQKDVPFYISHSLFRTKSNKMDMKYTPQEKAAFDCLYNYIFDNCDDIASVSLEVKKMENFVSLDARKKYYTLMYPVIEKRVEKLRLLKKEVREKGTP